MRNVSVGSIRIHLFFILISIFSILIYFLIPLCIEHFPILKHFAINHYLLLLRDTILFLPVAFILYFIYPVRKFLDYERYISKLKSTWFLILIFSLSMVATNFISWHYYHHIPQQDDIPSYYQAKIFKTLHRWGPSPDYPEFFNGGMVNSKGRHFSMSAPGHSLVLLLGFFIGIPWIICPLLGSLSLIIFYLILRDIFNVKTARTGAVFLLLSPTFLFMSASFLNQNSSLFFLLLALLLIVKSVKVGARRVMPLLAGLCVGFAFFSRPAIPLAFLVASIVFLSIIQKSEVRCQMSDVFLLIAGFLPFLFLQFYDNILLTGNPFQYGYSLCGIAGQNDLGFGIGKGYPTFGIPGHTPLKALINLIYNYFIFSLHLFGWPALSLIFIFLWRPRKEWDYLFLGIVGCAIIFMGLFWYHGISYIAPLYYYEIIPLLILLTVRGIKNSKINIRPLITLLFLIDIFIYIPQATKIFSIAGSNLNCYNEIKKQGIHHAILFIRDLPGEDERTRCINRHNYNSVCFRNEVKLEDSDIIYARDLGDEQNFKLKNLYPNRKAYIFEYLDSGSPRSGKTYHLIPDY